MVDMVIFNGNPTSFLNQSKVTQCPNETSLKANLISSKVSVEFRPISKQNFIHARCFAILSIVKSRFYTNRLNLNVHG